MYMCWCSDPATWCDRNHLRRLEEDEAKKPAVPPVRATSASSAPSAVAATAAGGRPSTAGSGTLAVATQVLTAK